MAEAAEHPLSATERRRLVGIAFRMLGTIAEAEDAVQEACVRWVRLDEPSRSQVRDLPAWMTTVTTRVCLDVLGSARLRREAYVGPWLPEPLPESTTVLDVGDPVERATLRESVSTALLLMMERMTPAERVAFVLHDVFGYPFAEIGEMIGRSTGASRELASSGRGRLGAPRRHDIDPRTHADTVVAFLSACETGDVTRLASLLDPGVVLTSDGGGSARAALNPILGRDKVARFVLGVRRRRPDVWLELGTTPDGPAILFVEERGINGVLNLGVVGDTVVEAWIQWNPHKLTLWNST